MKLISKKINKNISIRKKNREKKVKQSRKIGPWGAQRAKKEVRPSNKGVGSSPRGSLFEEKKRLKDQTKQTRDPTRQGAHGPANFSLNVGRDVGRMIPMLTYAEHYRLPLGRTRPPKGRSKLTAAYSRSRS